MIDGFIFGGEIFLLLCIVGCDIEMCEELGVVIEVMKIGIFVYKDFVVDIYCEEMLINDADNCEYLLNALRCVCCAEIPIYAFGENDINVITNTSKIKTSILRKSLSQIPILNFEHDIHFLEDTYYKQNENDEYVKHPNDNNMINCYINFTNEENHMVELTTEHITMKINNRNRSTMFKQPVLICLLNPGESVQAEMTATLSVGLKNSIHNASHTVSYNYADENNKAKDKDYILVIESSGQLSYEEIFRRGCEILIIKYEHIKEVIKQSYKTKGNNIIKRFVFENEKISIIYPISFFLRKNKNINYSTACNSSSLLKFQCALIAIHKNENLDCYEEIYQAIDSCISYYNRLLNTNIKK